MVLLFRSVGADGRSEIAPTFSVWWRPCVAAWTPPLHFRHFGGAGDRRSPLRGRAAQRRPYIFGVMAGGRSEIAPTENMKGKRGPHPTSLVPRSASGACRPVLAKNSPQDCFPGAQTLPQRGRPFRAWQQLFPYSLFPNPSITAPGRRRGCAGGCAPRRGWRSRRSSAGCTACRRIAVCCAPRRW